MRRVRAGRRAPKVLSSDWRLVCALAVAACAGDEPAEKVVPEYSEGAYATVPGAGEGTDLRFTEVARESGIDFVHENGAFGEKWMPETVGSGAAFFDYDGNGSPDLLLVNGTWWEGHEGTGPRSTQRLYRNLGDGRFQDVTANAGLDLSIYGMGVTVADYDADGDADIYLTAVGSNVLLRNDGGRFTDVTVAAGVTGNAPDAPDAWSSGAAWLDYDRDGWLDLFVCNYVRWTSETDLFATIDGTSKSYATPQQYEGESCRLYRNGGAGRFADVTEAAGVSNAEGKSLGVAVADFDEDGWPDLIVANDTQRNFLYRNDADGSFTDIAVRAGVAFDEAGRARAGMGVAVADLTGEGRWSIAIGNFAHEPLALFTQIGDNLFQDRAGAARLTRSTLRPLTFGVLFADFDLDGHMDLMSANGHIEPGVNLVQAEQTFEQAPQLFLGDGTGRFSDVSGLLGEAFATPIVGRGVLTADVDADGDLDALLTVNGGAARLYRNDLNPGSATWIELWLEGAHPNLDALGAMVLVYTEAGVQRRYVGAGSSYLSQSLLNPLRFALGEAAAVDSFVVRWPRGERTVEPGPISTGQTITVREHR
ncbi:MAG: CRTAC1 family protein [Gemmatimonadota bacterium]|nr:CRTAC1 family protein [Gemmatimonadota bacterium]